MENTLLYKVVKKAVELKIIPKWADEKAYLENWDKIEKLLNFILNETDTTKLP